MRAERKRRTDRGWRKRVNWKRNREEGPDLRGCGVASLYITICVCVCVCVLVNVCVFVCLGGDDVVDLMRTKLIRDFALHNSTMMFPQDPGQHLPPILHPPERKREPRDFFILTFFILHVKQILQASGYMSAARSMEGAQWEKMKRRLCCWLCDFDIRLT